MNEKIFLVVAEESPLCGLVGRGVSVGEPALRIATALLARAYMQVAATQLKRRSAAILMRGRLACRR